MNCPSRTDDTLLHDEWNQNPPRFAPDLTTRQDLLGISNTRENKGDKNGLALLQNHSNWAHAHWPRISDLGKRLHGVGEASIGPLAPQKNLSIRHGELDLNKTPLSYQKVKDWALWLLSVLFISALISHNSLGNCFIPKAPLALETTFLVEQQDSQPAKRSSCAVGGVREAAYDLPLHVAALFIILGTSTIACAFPILATRFPRLHIPPSFLFFVSHFGTGVLIATAFVHLLPTAFQSLGDPCLSSFWTNDYPAMPGAIALAGVFFITVIEMVFSPAQSICRGGNYDLSQKRSSSGPERDTLAQLDDYTSAEPRAQSSHSVTLDYQPHVRDMGPLVGRSSSISRVIHHMSDESETVVRVLSTPETQTHHEKENGVFRSDIERDNDHHILTPEQNQRKETMQVYLLEMGILFHSIFIGMSLSVSIGSEFVILLIAIVFHQTFEGLALGSRIASLSWSEKQLQPWFMSLAYGCTTPIGQAIGLATHTLYSPDSEVGLLVVGIMNAISAGLLIFASLVELMSEDFLSDESWRILRGRRRVYAFLLVCLGAFCMSIVGAWA
ncbi:hypothetical protein DTO013E5_9741 [Penicillium roqueforti]|uniref:Zinc/iron permease n=1 Tax=Penicillium roqueforti (strain FM164) TaxID=1365484 RepID=W6QNG7_PENRF|nr:hypothetical protein DTO013F2_10419 [Penicillium roqueforti]CDM38458.1 Zinc/iron permease [Penicillium roqueforti FM164]KAI2734732.1 hypothetical protein DTO012A1_9802 [Penicillium roqueforti]KAI2766952.1 hypothetical protein DTO012A8_7825 [Penicillium roqueforti]KAI3062811.1 hypothetical protein CBS147339_9798 [Penicillium roqueforti]